MDNKNRASQLTISVSDLVGGPMLDAKFQLYCEDCASGYQLNIIVTQVGGTEDSKIIIIKGIDQAQIDSLNAYLSIATKK